MEGLVPSLQRGRFLHHGKLGSDPRGVPLMAAIACHFKQPPHDMGILLHAMPRVLVEAVHGRASWGTCQYLRLRLPISNI